MTIPLKRLAECRDDLRRPVNATERAKMQGDIPYWGANQIQDYVDTALVDGQTVLIGEDGAPFFDRNRDVAFYVDEPIWPNNHIHVLKPLPHADPRWLAYALNSVDFSRWISGSTRDKLTQADLMRIELPSYSLGRQSSIADYLDRETATIDALIEKQRQLIEGLRERGDASWRRLYDSVLKTVRPLPLRRHVQSISDGPFGSALTSAHYAASGVRVIRLGNIGPGVFKLGDEAFISHEYGEKLKRYAVSPGDLIMAGLGDSNVSLGRTAEVPEGLGPAINKADCFRLRLHAGVDPRYMVVALNAPQTRELVLQLAQGSTRQRMNTSVAARVPVAVPDPRCQAQVVEQWESKTATIDALIAKAERFIELALERRAALITAAVTGQIEIPT